MSEIVPAPTDLSPEAAEAFRKLTPKQQRFVVLTQRYGNKSQAYREAYGAYNWGDASVASEAYKTANLPQISLILGSAVETAKAMLVDQALKNVERSEKLAAIADNPDTESASRLAVAERAIRTSYEAAGIIGRGASVQVNIDARRIDAEALRLWNERQANDSPSS